MTVLACCAICQDARPNWVEIADLCILLCQECINGIKPVAVMIYDNRVPVSMAIELHSEYTDWQYRIIELNGYLDAMQRLYDVIDQLIEVKFSTI